MCVFVEQGYLRDKRGPECFSVRDQHFCGQFGGDSFCVGVAGFGKREARRAPNRHDEGVEHFSCLLFFRYKEDR